MALADILRRWLRWSVVRRVIMVNLRPGNENKFYMKILDVDVGICFVNMAYMQTAERLWPDGRIYRVERESLIDELYSINWPKIKTPSSIMQIIYIYMYCV